MEESSKHEDLVSFFGSHGDNLLFFQQLLLWQSEFVISPGFNFRHMDTSKTLLLIGGWRMTSFR